MKKAFVGIAACAMAVVVALAAILSAPGVALAEGGVDMHRLYNPNSGEHFYTASRVERDRLQSVGWRYERVAWAAPTSGEDVYRVYNPNGGDHHYTTSAGERDLLVKAGWHDEGSGWQSGGSVAVYRLYNPSAATGAHHYTTSAGERDQLVAVGWHDEGVGWYATSAGGEPEQTLYLAGSNWLIELPEYWNGKVSVINGKEYWAQWGYGDVGNVDDIIVVTPGVDAAKMRVMLVRAYSAETFSPDDFPWSNFKTARQVTLANGTKLNIYNVVDGFGDECYYAKLPDGGYLEVDVPNDSIHVLGKPMSAADAQILLDMLTFGVGATGDNPAECAREYCLAELASRTYLF